jgi:hypothetical protein
VPERPPIPFDAIPSLAALGTTVETAIRVRSRWQKKGLVETEKKGFLIRRLGGLREIAPVEE